MTDKIQKKDVAINRIFLDLENPRHEPYENQSEAIEYLCRKENIVQLAKDIVKHGVNPLELCALVPIDQTSKSETYFVAEGNRRICAIKLLDDPDLAPAKLRKSFEKLAGEWSGIPKLPSVIFDTRENVALWLDRIHNGAQNGIGRRTWNAEQKTRHSGDSRNKLAQAILDYGERNRLISSNEREGKITTVQRYVGNPLVQDALGLDNSNPDGVYRNRTLEDFNLLLGKFFRDLVSASNVNSRKNKPEIQEYARKLTSLKGQSHDRIEPEPIATENGKVKRRTKRRPKKHQLQKHVTYEKEIHDALDGLGGAKLSSLYYSICEVSVVEHAPLISVGIWSFFESLSGKAGRTSDAAFTAFFSKERLQKYGYKKGKESLAVREALNRVAASGNVTKHDSISANFSSEQIANDMDTLKSLILNCIEDVPQ